MFKNYNHLGFNNPFYIIKNGKFHIYKTFSEAIQNYPYIAEIDPVSVIELLNNNYILADRTIIKGISYTPWMAKPNKEMNSWEYYDLPQHGNLDISEDQIAEVLFNKICNEIINYVGDKTKIGILLSGGMDSRMVAGALDYLLKSRKLKNIEVTALTWGNDGSRDIIYANEIAKRMGWKWKNYKVDAKAILQNITETAIWGCNFSPIDLHGIPQIRDDNKELEVILAGSYGDSIGRAEYFGWKIKNAPSIKKKNSNFGYIIADDVYKNYIFNVDDDINAYHQIFQTTNPIARKEHDLQLHYMRRMLNPCMNLLNSENTKFYQVFTSPDTFGFMWSVSLKKRNDLIYKYMYKLFVTPLEDIPWSRTGLKYGEKKGNPDPFLKDHHNYISIIQNELLDELENIIFSSSLFKLNIFNKKSIFKIFNLLKKYPVNNLLFLNKITWLASLSKLIDLYDIKTNEPLYESKDHNFIITYEYIESALRKKIGPYLKNILQRK